MRLELRNKKALAMNSNGPHYSSRKTSKSKHYKVSLTSNLTFHFSRNFPLLFLNGINIKCSIIPELKQGLSVLLGH